MVRTVIPSPQKIDQAEKRLYMAAKAFYALIESRVDVVAVVRDAMNDFDSK